MLIELTNPLAEYLLQMPFSRLGNKKVVFQLREKRIGSLLDHHQPELDIIKIKTA